MFTEGQRVTITRGTNKGAAGTVHGFVCGRYVVTLDATAARDSIAVDVKAPSLRAR